MSTQLVRRALLIVLVLACAAPLLWAGDAAPETSDALPTLTTEMIVEIYGADAVVIVDTAVVAKWCVQGAPCSGPRDCGIDGECMPAPWNHCYCY